jgi:predicted nucleic acid-binding protein
VRFWDSSAVIPLLVQQQASAQADSWYAQDTVMVLWTLTTVETLSGLQRLLRDGMLSEAEVRAAEHRLTQVVQTAHVVERVDAVKATATRLLRMHPLRAADALQLGAALCWARSAPAGHSLITLDERLARAAVSEGFSVLPALASR